MMAEKKEEGENKPDDIASSTTDDMFAFSQIIAQGEKVSKVTSMIEKQ